MTQLDMEEPREYGHSEWAGRPGRRRRRVLFGFGAFIGLLATAGWFFFNGLPLPVTAADRAALLTARDLEPWVPGLSAVEGTETVQKRMSFFWSRGIDTKYEYVNLKTPRVGLICRVTLCPTEQDAAGTFDVHAAATQMAFTFFGLGRLFDPSCPWHPVTERDDLLRWGDASNCVQYGDGNKSGTSFLARKGRRVFTLLLFGPWIQDEGLRRILPPRLEALGRG